jgi:4-amino-4-deoxy-L-arabinose transferase-like glycosyltransferase
MTPSRALLWLILAGTIVRILFGWGIGLGVDESYMVVAGRGALRLGYFDHPLISWWMSNLAARMAGTEAAVVVRLPFIALFALSTWLMFRVGAEIAGARAGLWAAIAFNLAPVMGVTSGGWVLPDGPLVAALLGAVLCALQTLAGRGFGWWLGFGGCAGLAMLSKYTAVLPLAGFVAFLAVDPRYRAWLLRPQPYAALALALLVFSPVVIWNAGNGWASLAFQGARAGASRFNLFGPVVTLAGEAAFLLPWIWVGLCLVLWQGFRAGDARVRLLCWMAWPAIALFAVVSLWSRQVLFHWATPGYLMLFPLLGAWLADRAWAPRAAWATSVLLAMAMLLVVSETRLPWVPLPAEATLSVRDWSALRPAVLATHLPVAAISWSDTGKAGIGLGPDVPIFCLNIDAREFRFSTHPPSDGDLVIVAPRRTLASMRQTYVGVFQSIEALPPVRIGGVDIALFVGRGLKRWP